MSCNVSIKHSPKIRLCYLVTLWGNFICLSHMEQTVLNCRKIEKSFVSLNNWSKSNIIHWLIYFLLSDNPLGLAGAPTFDHSRILSKKKAYLERFEKNSCKFIVWEYSFLPKICHHEIWSTLHTASGILSSDDNRDTACFASCLILLEKSV